MRAWVLWLFVSMSQLFVATLSVAQSCPTPVAPMPSGGCRLTLTTATNCQTLDASASGYYEFAWTTSGTFCESPMKILITGSPDSSWQFGNNYLLYTLSAGTQSGYSIDRSVGGYIHLAPSALAQLTTDNGTYSWGLQSYYGASSGSGVFTVGNAGSPPSVSSDSDRIFNWVEAQFAQYLKPAGAQSRSTGGYYFRYYTQTNVYLATLGSNLYVYGPQLFGNSILDLGAMSSWLTQAQAAGY